MGVLSNTERQIMRLYGTGKDIAVIADLVGIPRDGVGDLVNRLCRFNRQRAAELARSVQVSTPAAAAPAVPKRRPGPKKVDLAGGELSPREVEFLASLAAGESYVEMATRLFLSESTVATTIARMYAKLGVSSAAPAVLAGVRRGLLPGAPITAAAEPAPAPVPTPEPEPPLTMIVRYPAHLCESHKYTGPADGHRCRDMRPVLVTISEVR